MILTLVLAHLSGKHDLEPWALYAGTLWLDLATIVILGSALGAHP